MHYIIVVVICLDLKVNLSKSQSPYNATRSIGPRQQSAVRKSYNSLDKCRRCGRDHDAKQSSTTNYSHVGVSQNG